MFIERNGEKYELTWDEMNAAYDEIYKMVMIDDIEQVIDELFVGDDVLDDEDVEYIRNNYEKVIDLCEPDEEETDDDWMWDIKDAITAVLEQDEFEYTGD